MKYPQVYFVLSFHLRSCHVSHPSNVRIIEKKAATHRSINNFHRIENISP